MKPSVDLVDLRLLARARRPASDPNARHRRFAPSGFHAGQRRGLHQHRPHCPLVFVLCSSVTFILCCCSSFYFLLPARFANHSASGFAINSCDVLVEEGGPRVEAKRRGGDPLPRCQVQSQSWGASGQLGASPGCLAERAAGRRAPESGSPGPQTMTAEAAPRAVVRGRRRCRLTRWTAR
jgi:hypothetical protein